MNKLAVFVEGYSEVLFLDHLISEIGGAQNVLIEQRKIKGGSKFVRTMSTIKATKPNTGQKYYFLLVDCGGDALVNERIREEHKNLTLEGYTKIIGMRDVRPTFTYEDIPRLETNLKKYIKTSLIPVEFVLEVMELEAWFLAEYNHFPKIEPSITVSEIKRRLGFDPELDDLAHRPNPMDDLNAAYMIGGMTYRKGQPTPADILDYPYIYLELQNKIPYLKRLINSIEAFLA